MQVSIFGRLRSAGDICVPLRYARQFLGSVYAMQVKFEVRLRYAGHFLGLCTLSR